ncbi:hypothetical protein AO269_13215 [Pseudomonas putida]|nr:hypothetical protein AO269_13215 [Pseudomonas putida]
MFELTSYLGLFLAAFGAATLLPMQSEAVLVGMLLSDTVSEAKLAKAQQSYLRYGHWSLLLSWVPIIGDPLTVVAGVMREPFWRFLLIVTLAKGMRYLVLAAVALGWT